MLFRKLQSIGVSRFAMEWFKSYLSGRSQYVRIGSTTSQELTITRGVPQGSILAGPCCLIYIYIYINDLPNVSRESSLESFVDDSKLFLSFPIVDAENAATKLSEDMNRITTWCCSNNLLVNPGKTKLLLIGTKQMVEQLPENFHITIFGKEIRPVLNGKDLGMLLDSRLSYDEQITSVVSTCIADLCQINRVKHILDERILILIINALIFSRMYYCSSVCSSTAKKNINKLQSVQNFAGVS